MLGEDSSDGFVGPTLDRRRSGPNEQATVAFAGNLVLPGASHDTNVDRSRSRNRRHEATLPPHPGASSPPITEPMVLAGVAAKRELDRGGAAGRWTGPSTTANIAFGALGSRRKITGAP